MRKLKKYTFLVLGILLLSGIVHYVLFPQETCCMLIDFSSFQQKGGFYAKPQMADTTQSKIEQTILLAEKKVEIFWGRRLAHPKYIYCETDADFAKYGGNPLAPAATQMKLNGYIVFNPKGIDVNIISHELCHAELYERLGFFKNLRTPMWFHEGLAMQVDDRLEYSTDTLMAKTDSLKKTIAVKELLSGNDFQSGDVKLNYLLAKYEVGKWYTPPKLEALLVCFKEGGDFDNCY